MPLLVKINLKCPFDCRYCYQDPMRKIGVEKIKYNIDETIEQIKELNSNNENRQITIHGGEPLAIPIDDLEKLFKTSFEINKRSSIQTNGYLITEKHIELFKKYKTGVGVSIDGDFPCNELRGKGTPKQRKKQTKKTLQNIKRLQAEKIPVSIISVMHKKNAVGLRKELFKQFLLNMSKSGITGRLNPCCDPEFGLTQDEAIDFYTDMIDFMVENNIRHWSPFRDIINLLKGNGNSVCVFKDCDPYCTQSAYSLLADGQEGVCLRLYTDGQVYSRDTKEYNTRSQILKQSDCKDCKWWKYCKGGCSGLSIDDDWRNKDRYCKVYIACFEKISKMLKFLEIKPTKKPSKPKPYKGGFEHNDSGVRHIDSDAAPQHNDGIEHIDSGVRHIDSN